MRFLCLNCDRDNIEYSFKYGRFPDLGNKIKKIPLKILNSINLMKY